MSRLGHGIAGMLWGVFLGVLVGLGVMIFFMNEPLFFPGDIILLAAVVCGLLGLIFGDRFLQWIEENWHWFS